MAVEALGGVVLQKLTDLLIHDTIAFDNVTDQIEDIRIQLRQMRGFLIGAELSEDDAAVAWATEYLRVLFSAEDEIEKYVLSLSARGRRNIGFLQRRGFTLFASVYDSCGPGKALRRALNLLAVEIRKLKHKRPVQVADASLRTRNHNLNELQEPGAPCAHGTSVSELPLPVERKRFESTESFPSNWRPNFQFGSLSPSARRSPRGSPGGHRRHPSDPIGFTLDKAKLVDRLKEGRGGGVIPLVGLAGSGKTTLVQTIYNLREIKTHFDCRAWIHVPDESITVFQILANLLQQLHKSKEVGISSADHHQLIARVEDFLKDKRYLIVLDHVNEVQLWKDLKSAFPNLDVGDSKSKVVLITRDEDVATSSISEQEDSQPHRLNQLCRKHSWELLIKVSGLDQGSGKLDDGFKDEVLRKCNGCPLQIVVLGGLLSTKGTSCDDWKWYLSQPNWSGMEILPLSYNDLPAHSKLCLLYMALFPNEVDIPVKRLHRLWLAEGFIRRSPGMAEEDTVEKCFDDLVQRNLIKISKLRSDGSPRRCRLPHALREYLSDIARQIALFYIRQGHQEPGTTPKLGVRRVIEYIKNENHNHASTSISVPSYENLRSYLSFNSQRNDTPAEEVGNFISEIIGNKGFGMLRVLDLEGVYKPTLPETLKLLFHLRYLGLRWTFIDHLPKSVGDLPFLETLDLKQTYINSLPRSIWKLENLRHLNLPGIHLNYKHKKGQSSLAELRTLEGLIVDDETDVKGELSHLRELRELGITCQLRSSDDLISWIQKLNNLRFLWLKSKDIMGQPSKINLKPLPELSELTRVSLLGHLQQLPDSNEFPPNLKVLALSVSRLEKDPMGVLSKLPCLSVLRLLADSYLGKKMECPRNGFQSLRVLKLWMLKKLEEWTVEEGGMPLLKELNIRYCCELRQLPSQLLHQQTLEELTLTSMPEEFVRQVKQEKRSHTVLTENNYTFNHLPWEKDPELWNVASGVQ